MENMLNQEMRKMKRKYLKHRKQLGLRTKAYVWIRNNNVEKEAIFDNKKNEFDNYVAFKGDDKSENFVRDFLLNLPKYSWKDCLKDSGIVYEKEDTKKNQEWKDHDLFNEIINTSIQKKEFKKLMRKAVLLKGGDIISFNIKSSDIDKKFRIEGKIQTIKEFSVDKGFVLLNALVENEAFEIYLNHK